MLPWTEAILDTGMDYEALAAAGSSLGTGGVTLIPKADCIVNATWNIVRFYAHESCGKCTPCREGIGSWMVRMYEKQVRGQGQPGDVQLILDMCDNIGGQIVLRPGRRLPQFGAEQHQAVPRRIRRAGEYRSGPVSGPQKVARSVRIRHESRPAALATPAAGGTP